MILRQHEIKENIWKGGVHLDEYMFSEIVQPSFCYHKISAPDRLYLPMKPENENACKVVVNCGDYIDRYGIVGIRDTGVAEEFHLVRTDQPGYIEDILKEQTGYKKFSEYVVIRKCEHTRTPVNQQLTTVPLENLTQTRHLLFKSGIPGINRILFHKNHIRSCRWVVLNAVQDDPSVVYMTLMIKERPGQLLYGLLIFLRLLKAEQVLIVLSQKQQKEIDCLSGAIDRYFSPEIQQIFSFMTVPDIYPGGRDELLRMNIASHLRCEEWVLVHMDQVLGCYSMIYDQKPWTKKCVMTCGFFEEKGCLEVPIGMKISELVRTEMIPNPSAHAIFIDGGLMSGKSVNPEKAVVHDTMQSLILMPKITECEQPCMHCGNCATVCPMGLRPFNGNAAEARQCIGCGNCSYICPSRRRLKEYMVHGGQPTLDDTGKKGYIYLKQDTRRLPAAVITGHSSPFVREGWMPFTCFLPPYQL